MNMCKTDSAKQKEKQGLQGIVGEIEVFVFCVLALMNMQMSPILPASVKGRSVIYYT